MHDFIALLEQHASVLNLLAAIATLLTAATIVTKWFLGRLRAMTNVDPPSGKRLKLSLTIEVDRSGTTAETPPPRMAIAPPERKPAKRGRNRR
jgi:hypothetical protein